MLASLAKDSIDPLERKRFGDALLALSPVPICLHPTAGNSTSISVEAYDLNSVPLTVSTAPTSMITNREPNTPVAVSSNKRKRATITKTTEVETIHTMPKEKMKGPIPFFNVGLMAFQDDVGAASGFTLLLYLNCAYELIVNFKTMLYYKIGGRFKTDESYNYIDTDKKNKTQVMWIGQCPENSRKIVIQEIHRYVQRKLHKGMRFFRELNSLSIFYR